jgi:hypothetical protein
MFKRTAKNKSMFLGGGILGKNVIKKIISRDQYTTSARDILDEMGDLKIKKMYIKRSPLSSTVKLALNAFSFGDFSKKMKQQNIDELYHLRIDVELENGKRYTVEKNSVITLTRRPKTTDNTQSLLVDVPTGTTVNMLLDKTQKKMGNKYFLYSAKNNNCSDFILALLVANGLVDAENRAFVKIETDKLFTNTFRRLTNTITDVAGGVENVVT